jgi:hypothetical protein
MGSAAGTASSDADATDWERRLSRGEKILWYGLAGVTYCGAAIFEKGLLNWIVGPIWLVLFVSAGPALTDRLRGRRPSRGRGRGRGRTVVAGEVSSGDEVDLRTDVETGPPVATGLGVDDVGAATVSEAVTEGDAGVEQQP